jgi:hypothetical protein
MENLDEYRERKVGLDIIGGVSGRVKVLHEESSRIGVVGGKVKNRILSVSDGVLLEKITWTYLGSIQFCFEN